MIYDVLIIGSGGAALSTAIHLKKNNKNVLVVSKSNITNAQTVQAQGGINAVLATNDSIENHIQDTIKSAHGLYDKDMIEYMCTKAPETILWLDSIGVPFNRNQLDKLDQRKLGGASHPRANYSSDYTGLKILQTLFDTALNLGVEFKEDCMMLNLLKEDNTISGISYIDLKTSNIGQIVAINTILASGGFGGVYHNYTTNSADTTADGQIAAYHAGCILENMEMVQFHPTALLDKFILISESARGEGGYLVNGDSQRFVDELLPRDVVAREIAKKQKSGETIYLDLRHLGKEKILHLMPQEYKICFDYLGLKMEQDLIPITPACHYTMGGIKVDKKLKTSLNNLYAIGEVSSSGVHGANRLGGNSLLEITTFCKKLVENLEYNNIPSEEEFEQTKIDRNKIESLLEDTGESFYKDRNQLGKVLYENVSLFRDEKSLNEALSYVKVQHNVFSKYGVKDKCRVFNMELKNYLEYENMLTCAQLIILSAIERSESRGAHFRSDFPDEGNVIYNTQIDNNKKVYRDEINNS